MTGTLNIGKIKGYDSFLNKARLPNIELGMAENGFLQWDGSGRVTWNATGGVLAGGYLNSSASIIRWDRVQVDDNNRYDYAAYYGVITEPKHIATKEYVDNNSGGSGIQVLPGNPANPKVGDAWFSTNQNTFIIKIA